jgi:dTDP-4-dehydrorhamnose 3,5-epimerase
MYKVDSPYSPECEGGLIWDDPDVDVPWPVDDPILAERDRRWPDLKSLKRDGDLF